MALFKRLILGLILMISSSAISQISALGIQPKLHFSRQIFVFKDMPKKFARSASERVARTGIDLYADFDLSERWQLRSKFGYEVKGYSRKLIDNVGKQIQGNQQYKYLATDLSLLKYWGENIRIQPYIFAGVSLGYLVKQNSTFPIYWTDEVGGEVDATELSSWNFSYTAGIGLSFDRVMWLEIERNGDIIPVYQSEEVNRRNVVTSVSVGVNLLAFFTKSDSASE